MLLLALLMFAPQAEADRLFALGNALTSEGDLRGAAAAYEGALRTGWTSPELELNLGHAYLKAGQLGRAVLHAERAHRLAPRHEAVRQRLRLVREEAGTPAPLRSPTDAAAAWLAAHVGAGGLAAFLLVVYLAVLGLVGFRLWTKEPRPWLRRGLVVLVPLAVLVAAATRLTVQHEASPRAVVMADTNVLSSPSSAAAAVDAAPEGLVLAVTAQRGLWRAVRLPGGGEGWVEASALEEI
ncbi:MAG: SH3 domain-containing protein [Bacteroidota bacterium]